MIESIEHLIMSGRDAILDRERRRDLDRVERERVYAVLLRAEAEEVLAICRASAPLAVQPFFASAEEVGSLIDSARERLDVPVRVPGLAPIWQHLHKGTPNSSEPYWICSAVRRVALPRETPTGAEYGEVGIIAHDWPTALALAADHAAEFTRLARLAAERIERDRDIPF